jgi:hypothetical protein
MVLAWRDMIHVNSSYLNITPSSARIHFQKTQLYDSWESAEALNLKIVYITYFRNVSLHSPYQPSALSY